MGFQAGMGTIFAKEASVKVWKMAISEIYLQFINQ